MYDVATSLNAKLSSDCDSKQGLELELCKVWWSCYFLYVKCLGPNSAKEANYQLVENCLICQSHPKACFRYLVGFEWLIMQCIVSWVVSSDNLCVLCRACTENRDHIFFKCPFTQRSWRIIKRWFCQEGLDDEWGNLITWAVQNWRGKIFRADCCRLGFIAGINHVWAQRNAVKHRGTVRTKEQI